MTSNIDQLKTITNFFETILKDCQTPEYKLGYNVYSVLLNSSIGQPINVVCQFRASPLIFIDLGQHVKMTSRGEIEPLGVLDSEQNDCIGIVYQKVINPYPKP